MERRTCNRSPVRLDVVVHDRSHQAWDFIVEDFAYGGLRLSWQNKAAMPDSIAENDLLDIKFSIKHDEQYSESSQQNGAINYRLEVKVVRVLENALAVAIFNPALDAIVHLSKQQETLHIKPTQSSSLNKKSLNILEAVKQSFMTNMSHTMEIFLPVAHEAIFQQAEQSSNNTQQALYFDAINTLNKSKQSLKKQFLKLFEKSFFSYDKQQQSNIQNQELDELELLDQNEFESWLAINQLIIHISPNYEQELQEIELRFAKLLEMDVNEINSNPFTPEIIFKVFSEAIHNHFINNDILLILYHQFEHVVNERLFDVYKEINQIFIDNNILPLIEKKKFVILKEPSAGKKPSAGQEPSTDAMQKAINAYQEHLVTDPGDTNSISGHHPQQQYQSATDLPQNYRNPYQAHVISADTAAHNSINLVSTYQTLKELLSVQNNQKYETPSADFFASGDYNKQLDLLLRDLTLIQYQQAKNVTKNGIVPFDLESLVQNCINKGFFSIEIKNEFEYALNIVKHMFSSIEKDVWVTKPVKKLLTLLQIPLLKISISHRDFLEPTSNPVRILINKLALVDSNDEKNKFYLKAFSVVLYVLKTYDRDLHVFTKVHEILTELLDIQSNLYNKNMSRVITNWNAQQVVSNELASRLSGQSLPVVIADFISSQWQPILVFTYINYGIDSAQWRQYLQALDMLILRINGEICDELIDQSVILFIIKQGLEENGQYNKKIMDGIESFLIKGESGNKILLNAENITELLLNGYALSDKSVLAKFNDNDKSDDAMTLANKAIAKRLKVYDYLLFKQGVKANKKTTRLQFVWGSDAQNVFVFSGRTGQQQAVFNLAEVVSLLKNGQLVQTRDYDLPLLERCLYATLGDAHDNIAKESVIDKLTGLINQREFIRLMHEKLEQTGETTHPVFKCAFCFIDIDHFSLINDTCGYDAGDQYISEISQVISQNLAEDVIISRYGSDEFILMLPNHSQTEAMAVSEAQRKAISHYLFKWQDKEFAMTSSIGLVAVSEYKEVILFLKAVITAAKIAKEMGRNRVHVFEHDALELNHRQELQVWATKVDQMIKNNQLDIRCQRLHPLLDSTTVQHYEMLLVVKDENGDYLPPAEFIEAAELYNKMTEVDRWVIDYVFDWFSRHPEQLEIMGGIAINLSGQSLNDVDFYPFIQDLFQQYPGIPREKICFEITETMAVTNMNYANNIIHLIKEMGCEFSLDDFGTGLSSYAYLKNLPVDYLKIDGVFIKDIVNNPADKAMVKSINEIGHFLGMKTVAEYVENDEIITVLKDIGVNYAQGFGIEKPILITEYMQHINLQESLEVHEKLKQLCSDNAENVQ